MPTAKDAVNKRNVAAQCLEEIRGGHFWTGRLLRSAAHRDVTSQAVRTHADDRRVLVVRCR